MFICYRTLKQKVGQRRNEPVWWRVTRKWLELGQRDLGQREELRAEEGLLQGQTKVTATLTDGYMR